VVNLGNVRITYVNPAQHLNVVTIVKVGFKENEAGEWSRKRKVAISEEDDHKDE